MANKRVSELAQITSVELTSADLFLLADVSAQQSKKLTLADLSSYILNGGNITGSFNGTSSWAVNALTASLLLGSITSASYALTASFALNGGSGGSTLSASFASASISASYAKTASFAFVTNASTASFATSSQFAASASFLIYTGGNNGTAYNAINAVTATAANSATSASYSRSGSYAITASFAITSAVSLTTENAISASYAIFAETASVGIITSIQTSASWASQSLSSSYADIAIEALTAMTASYLIPSPSVQNYGVFVAITQSNQISQIDKVTISSTVGDTHVSTSIEVVGNAIANYTSSTPFSANVYLKVLKRSTGETSIMDAAPIRINSYGQGEVWSTLASGSITFPYAVMGQSVLDSNEDYLVFVSASSQTLIIDPSRTNKFNIFAKDGQFSIGTGTVLQLSTTSPSDTITFSSSLGGPFSDTATNIVGSGSANILMMDISTVSGIKNIWTLPNLTNIMSFGNTLASDIGGMPASIVTMSLQSGVLTKLYNLNQTNVSILNFANNAVTTFPLLPATMSYINCSNNPILTFPSSIPYGVTQFYANATNATQPPSSFDAQVVSMSFSNSSNLNLWLTALPSSLGSFDVSNCSQLTALPTIPINVRYLNVSNDGMTDIAQDNICSNLVSNGLFSGSLNLLGNAALLPITLTRISTLQSRGWTVTY